MPENATLPRALCPLCAADMSLRFTVPCDYRKPEIARPFQVHWCAKCDFGQVWPRPSNAEIADFYDVQNYYTHRSEGASRTDPQLPVMDRLRFHLAWRLDRGVDFRPAEIRFWISGTAPAVCEVGCGNGANLKRFLAEGYSVCGVEPDPAARSAAQSALYTVHEGTAEQLPIDVSERRFDVVLMSHVLEHCVDVNTALRNAISILKPGGILVIETPNCACAGFTDLPEEWPWTDIPRHLNFFTPTSLRGALEKHGIRIVDTRFRGYCRQFSTAWLSIQRDIRSAFSSHLPPQQSVSDISGRAWRLLLRTGLSSADRKYDSVRLIGTPASLSSVESVS